MNLFRVIWDAIIDERSGEHSYLRGNWMVTRGRPGLLVHYLPRWGQPLGSFVIHLPVAW